MKIAEQQRAHKEGQYDPFYWNSSVVVSDNLGKRLSSFGQRPNAESWPIEHILKCYYPYTGTNKCRGVCFGI